MVSSECEIRCLLGPKVEERLSGRVSLYSLNVCMYVCMYEWMNEWHHSLSLGVDASSSLSVSSSLIPLWMWMCVADLNLFVPYLQSKASMKILGPGRNERICLQHTTQTDTHCRTNCGWSFSFKARVTEAVKPFLFLVLLFLHLSKDQLRTLD